MVEKRGKRGRKVPVLLTPEMKTAMDVLVDKRKEVNISPKNPFFLHEQVKAVPHTYEAGTP